MLPVIFAALATCWGVPLSTSFVKGCDIFISELEGAGDDAFLCTEGEKRNPTKENHAFGVTLDYLKVICIITGFCLFRGPRTCCVSLESKS